MRCYIDKRLKSYKRLTTFVWTIPGDTHITLMPASAGSRLWRTLLNITCNKKNKIKKLPF